MLFFGVGAFSAGLITAQLLPLLAGEIVGNLCTTEAILVRESLALTRPAISLGVWVVALLMAVAMGALFGFLASYPAIRVKEEWYLAMILLVAAEMFRIIVRNTPQLGCGYNGLPGLKNPFSWISNYWLSDWAVNLSNGIYLFLIAAFVALSYFLAERWARSPYARLLKSIRDDRVLAETIGKDVKRAREQVMIIGSAIAGLAGALYVFYIGVAISEDYISAVTFTIWVMIVLGGIGNNRGALIGSLVIVSLHRGTQILGILLQQASIAVNPNILVYFDYMVEAGILLFLILFRPKGLIPEEPVKTIAYRILAARREEKG